ncbi:MAG TPA: tyrosine-protein phosphatase [Acidimicrobiia bacterium]|nr:tyrosine-protein phosphatase [Acidimicrobiia bacterium]
MPDRDRHVGLETCFNFRDLGGYETVEGRQVRWQAVYRSDSLHRLKGADLESARGLGLRTVIDLRATGELHRDGRFAHADDVAFHHLPMFEEDPVHFKPLQPDDPEPVPGVEYVAMATNGRAAVAAAFQVIAQGEHSVVFHCAAGKDRTGIVAALLLSSLGVPDELIVADYHLSERAFLSALAWAEENDPEMVAGMRRLPEWAVLAPKPTMQAFLDMLRERHGSIRAYLTDAGVDDATLGTLRTRLLT